MKKPVKSPKPETPASTETLRDLSEVFKMLGDRSRLTIMMALSQSGPLHVTALRDLLDQSQPAVSHHLALLRAAHLVRCDRQGKRCYYKIDSVKMKGLLDQLFAEMANGDRQIHMEDISLSLRRK